MGCDTRYATVQQYDNIMCTDLDISDPDVILKIENLLDLAASDIQASLAASGQCDCALAPWAERYLQKLNILEAAVIYDCPCGDVLTPEARENLRTWLEKQLELIREGKIAVCDGDKGMDYPAFASAQQSLTDFAAATIIVNRSDL